MITKTHNDGVCFKCTFSITNDEDATIEQTFYGEDLKEIFDHLLSGRLYNAYISKIVIVYYSK